MCESRASGCKASKPHLDRLVFFDRVCFWFFSALAATSASTVIFPASVTAVAAAAISSFAIPESQQQNIVSILHAAFTIDLVIGDFFFFFLPAATSAAVAPPAPC